MRLHQTTVEEIAEEEYAFNDAYQQEVSLFEEFELSVFLDYADIEDIPAEQMLRALDYAAQNGNDSLWQKGLRRFRVEFSDGVTTHQWSLGADLKGRTSGEIAWLIWRSLDDDAEPRLTWADIKKYILGNSGLNSRVYEDEDTDVID